MAADKRMMTGMTTPRLAAPDLLDRAIEVLADGHRQGANVSGRSLTPHDFLTNYYHWHTHLTSQLSGVVTSGDVQRLLVGPNHWPLRSLDPNVTSLRSELLQELNEIRDRLGLARKTLDSVRTRWRRDDDALVVPDTSLLLHHKNDLSYLPWSQMVDDASRVRVVLLLQVIDELDAAKEKSSRRARARDTLRQVYAAGIAGTGRRHRITQEAFGSVTIEVLGDDLTHQRLADSDSEIIDRSRYLAELADRKVLLLTSDTGMVVRANEAGLSVRLIPTPDEL